MDCTFCRTKDLEKKGLNKFTIVISVIENNPTSPIERDRAEIAFCSFECMAKVKRDIWQGCMYFGDTACEEKRCQKY